MKFKNSFLAMNDSFERWGGELRRESRRRQGITTSHAPRKAGNQKSKGENNQVESQERGIRKGKAERCGTTAVVCLCVWVDEEERRIVVLL